VPPADPSAGSSGIKEVKRENPVKLSVWCRVMKLDLEPKETTRID
jgi:hypothetical protein